MSPRRTTMRLACSLILLAALFALAACGGTSSGTAARQADRQAIAAAGGARSPAAIDAVDASVDSSQAPASTQSLAARNASDPSLQPLSTGDIDFYVSVMRAAADRVRHPTAADAEALRRYHAWNAASDAAVKADQVDASKQAALSARLDENGAALKAAFQRRDVPAMKKLAAQQQQDLDAIAQSQHSSPSLDTETMNHATMLDGDVDDLIVQERDLDADRYARVKNVIEDIIVPPAVAALAVDSYCGDCTYPPDWTAEQIRQQRLYEQRLAAMHARNKKALAPYATEIRSLQAVVKPAKKS